MMTFLKYYMYLFSLLMVVSLLAKIYLQIPKKYDETPLSVWIEEYATFLMFFIGIIGMYGFVNNVSILNVIFWQFYSLTVVAHIVVSLWLPKFKWLRAELTPQVFLCFYIGSVILTLPFYFMVTRYAGFWA